MVIRGWFLAWLALAALMTGAAPTIASASSSLTPAQVRSLRQALSDAESHGLSAGAYWSEGRDQSLQSSEPSTRAWAETALVEATARYAHDLRSGRLERGDFPAEWALRPAPYDPDAGLEAALVAGRLDDWLQSLPPPAPAYARLRTLLARYRAIVADGGWAKLPSGAALKAGAQDVRVPALRARLAVEDPTAMSGEGAVFDEGLSKALARFQTRHGIAASGNLDAGTLAQLNVPADARVAQIEANMERLRWLPRDLPEPRIEVNIAAQTLSYIRPGAPTFSMRTVVGRPSGRTPIFADQVEAVVFNPPWNVPSSIATNEILPRLRRDPRYLARNDFVIQEGPGPVSVRLQQRPGPKSALGLVKFDLPNAFNVYLHDTPAKSLFAADRRAFSHGCIRLEKPLELARMVLAGDPVWTPERIQRALDEGVTVRAPLARPIPVFISYWTVFVDADGQANFRSDLYDWDARLTAALDADG